MVCSSTSLSQSKTRATRAISTISEYDDGMSRAASGVGGVRRAVMADKRLTRHSPATLLLATLPVTSAFGTPDNVFSHLRGIWQDISNTEKHLSVAAFVSLNKPLLLPYGYPITLPETQTLAFGNTSCFLSAAFRLSYPGLHSDCGHSLLCYATQSFSVAHGNAAYHPPGKSKEAPASRIDMKYTKDTGNLPQQLASLQQVEGGTEQAEKPLTDEHSQESAEGLIPAARLSSAQVSANPMLYQRFQEGYLVEINEVREGGMAIRVHSQKAVEVPRGIHKKVHSSCQTCAQANPQEVLYICQLHRYQLDKDGQKEEEEEEEEEEKDGGKSQQPAVAMAKNRVAESSTTKMMTLLTSSQGPQRFTVLEYKDRTLWAT
ncbi:hypothetical protein U0070_004498 [Myodes glareolus]|uniref:Uncharacterized protein n=1 Tax=Myodes glareolus TaxID=447135 RepID=A0AAW0IBF6_MYOGA